MPAKRIALVLLLTASLNSHALQSVCFSQAETYYEQVYCEIKREDPGAVLPSFADFRRNPPLTQALLLKRKAAALGINVKMPTGAGSKAATSERVSTKTAAKSSARPDSCALLGQRIQCGTATFVQKGNLQNHQLPAQALSPSNQLHLSVFSGNLHDRQQVLAYLSKAYIRYLEGMLSIGLAAETMSFTKFFYLFEDVTNKGADFAQRFQIMFEYLKKDKQNIAINASITEIQGIGIAQCERLTEQMFVCDNTRRNGVFLRE